MSTTLTHPLIEASTRPKASKPSRLPYLDGLRACAMLWVLFGHMIIFGNGSLLPSYHGLYSLLKNWLYYVHFAVDIFIVLSGYCLAVPVVGAGNLRGGALLFFKKRAHRILPPFYAAAVVSAIIGLADHQIASVSLQALWVNALMLQDVLQKYVGINDAFWSIGLEWKIYFLFPLFAWLLMRCGKTVMLAASASIAYALQCTALAWQSHHPASAFQPLCVWYVFLFGLGIFSAAVVHAPSRAKDSRVPVGTIAALAIPGIVLFALTLRRASLAFGFNAFAEAWPYYDAAIGMMTAAFLAWVGCQSLRGQQTWPARVLSCRPLVLLGTFSYSVYLLHFPLLLAVLKILNFLHLSNHPLMSCLFCIGAPIIIALSYLFFLAFERPFLNSYKRQVKAETAIHFAPAPDVSTAGTETVEKSH